MMKDLLTTYRDAEKKGVAVGHFNVSDLTTLKAVVAAAQELNVPVVIGASEGERKFLGDQQLAALVKSFREETGLPVFLNANHTHSLEGAVTAAKAGFDSIDGYLSSLIHADAAVPIAAKLEAELLEGLAGTGREFGAADWERKKRELIARHQSDLQR